MTEPGLHRVSARVTDVAGNQNWAGNVFRSRLRTRPRANGTSEKELP